MRASRIRSLGHGRPSPKRSDPRTASKIIAPGDMTSHGGSAPACEQQETAPRSQHRSARAGGWRLRGACAPGSCSSGYGLARALPESREDLVRVDAEKAFLVRAGRVEHEVREPEIDILLHFCRMLVRIR